MVRRRDISNTPSDIKREIANIQQSLSELTIRLATLNQSIDETETTPPAPTRVHRNTDRGPRIGDLVRFNVKGRGNVIGRVVSVTEKRIHIVERDGGPTIQRAQHNVTRVEY
jgi:hypothetical protein